ncbi:hypothetical protein ACIQZG_22640 [Lysinibacillus sp. NPDC096418]|uniref:hypothetical protein n=1 Tax=Lysinibacillus sp. NPDC096418 TaxID=3364138 RepID=UPI0037F84894
MKSWYIKNKNLLILFAFTSLITFLLTLLEVNFIVTNVDEFEEYAKTGVVSDTLKWISLLGLFNVSMLTIWTCFFIYIILKIIFPNRKTVENALFIDELNFLKNMPNELRRGLDKR